MPDMLEQGADWLARTQRSHVSQRIQYARGDSDLCIRATRGRSVFEVADEQNFLTKIEVQDYIVVSCDFVIDGLQSEPQRGDRITDGDNVFEVMPIGNEPCFRYTDEHRVQMRIHCKKVG